MAPILRKIRAISVSRTARVFVDGGASICISVIFGLSSLPDGYRFKRPCTDRSRCLAAVPVIELSGVIPADHIHERIDVHGGLGAIVDVIRMLEHVEREDRAPAGERRRMIGGPLVEQALVAR